MNYAVRCRMPARLSVREGREEVMPFAEMKQKKNQIERAVLVADEQSGGADRPHGTCG